MKKKKYPPQKKKSIKKVSQYSFVEKRIIKTLNEYEEREFSSRELLRLTKLSDKSEFYGALRELAKKKVISLNAKHKVKLIPKKDSAKAVLVSLSGGFGFARSEKYNEDIFIPGRHLNSALVGDEVIISDIKKDEKGYFGKITGIEKPAKDTTTATILGTDRGYYAVPDVSIRYNLLVHKEDLNGAQNTDKVLIRILKDGRGEWTRAKVLEIFGNSQVARICADAIIAQQNVPMVFSDEVLKNADEVSKISIDDVEISKRLDLRDENIFTIDGADAKDLDDAIGIKKLDFGYELSVHIADVSHYVKARTPLDEEAMSRGTSVYFADRVIPMYPEVLSNGVCSLNSGTDKLCFSAIIKMDKDGEIINYEFKKAVINSKVRGVYDEINEIFDGTADEATVKKYKPIENELKIARELALILKKKAKQRGTMEIDSGESKFVLDENGVCIDVIPRPIGESQELIEQFMISANIVAAKTAEKYELPFLYRVHESPDPKKVTDFGVVLQLLNVSSDNLFKGELTTADFAEILDKSRGSEAEIVISKMLLRTMEKAKYSHIPTGHFGLALKDYSHFTSPIRRYPDTVIHRILSAMVDGERGITKKYGEFVKQAGVSSSANEIRAQVAQRDAQDCYMAEYMKAHIGEEYEGIVSGVVKTGVFVRLYNNVEGFVSVDDFAEYAFEKASEISFKCRKTGKVLTLGTKIDIVVASADVAGGRIDFMPK